MSIPPIPRPERRARWDWALPHITRMLQTRRPRQVLVLEGPAGGGVGPFVQDGQWTRVVLDPQAAPGAVWCRADGLPFQSRLFELVLAVQVFGEGNEPVLGEIARVLEPGGSLLALGAGYWSGKRRRDPELASAPAIRASRLRRALAAHAFSVDAMHGHGLAGLPLDLAGRWVRPLAGVADAVLVLARRQGSRPVVTPLRFSRRAAVRPHPAVLDGLNREAAN